VSGAVKREEARIENQGDVRVGDRSASNTPAASRNTPYDPDAPTEKQ